MIRQFAELHEADLDKRIEKYKEDLAAGTCQSFEAYKRVCGMIAGLREAKDLQKSLLNRYDNDDLEEMNQ